MKFSLLVATLNRSDEVKNLLNSLRLSIEKDFEVIIVDQSDNDLTKIIVDIFSDLNIKYIKSNIRGLSLNRNIALSLATGEYYCFPDDDCRFYPDTLDIVKKIFDSNKLDFVLGRIFDRDNNKNILKKWPETTKVVNYFNCYFLSSSITMFYSCKCQHITFDENMGVGARYGACEDPDYLYRVLAAGFKGKYLPIIELWHPQQRQADLSPERVVKYTSGFGFYIRKNISLYNLIFLSLYVLSKFINFISFKMTSLCFKAILKGIFYGLLKK